MSSLSLSISASFCFKERLSILTSFFSASEERWAASRSDFILLFSKMKETLLQGFLSGPYFLRPSEVFSRSLEIERSLVSISTTGVLISTFKRPTQVRKHTELIWLNDEGLARLVSAQPYGRSRVRFPGVTTNPSFDFLPFRVALSSFKYPYNGALMEREGANARIDGLRFVTHMTISSYRQKIRTLYLYLFLARGAY